MAILDKVNNESAQGPGAIRSQGAQGHLGGGEGKLLAMAEKVEQNLRSKQLTTLGAMFVGAWTVLGMFTVFMN